MSVCCLTNLKFNAESTSDEHSNIIIDPFLPNNCTSAVKKPVNDCEGNFYQNIAKYAKNGVHFYPEFYGLLNLKDSSLLFMEDLTFGYSKPAVLDVKIGKQSYEPTAKPEKIKRMAAKDAKTTSAYLGLRITGYTFYDEIGNIDIKSKKETYAISSTELFILHLSRYFFDGKQFRTDIILHLLPTIRELLAWKQNVCEYNFYSSSLLFTYDAYRSETTGRLRMIDMAHVVKSTDVGEERDEGFIFGLQHLISILENLCKNPPIHFPTIIHPSSEMIEELLVNPHYYLCTV